MSGVIATLPKFQFSANGVPMVGGTVDVYVAGGLVRTDTWQDSALSTANTNPITLDARGECVLWLDSAVVYKFVLKSSPANGGVVQWTQDNISNPAALRIDLSASSGASLVGYLPAGTGAVATTAQAKLRESVSVKDFGALGDGATDDTAAFALAVTHCAANALALFVPNTASGYVVSKVRLKNGMRAFYSNGAKLVGNSATTEAVVEMDGDYFTTTAVDNCLVYGFTLDGGGVARRGIFAATALNCKIFSNTIKNMSATLADSGINLYFGSAGNEVYANHITLPIPAPGSYATGISLSSNVVDSYAGWMNGSIVQPTQINNRNIITGNYVYGGSHGIGLFGAQNNTVIGNICQSGRDRGIILSPVASYNIVTENQCFDFGSSGIHLAYGSVSNTITGNNVRSMTATGEAGIQAYVACSDNKISDNKIACTSKYGVYLAIDAYSNEVSTNQITGCVLAGVAIESDWAAVNPALAIYSRPGYSAPIAPRVNWYNGGTFGNSVTGNVFDSLGAGVCAIYLAQLGVGSTNQENVIAGNLVRVTAPAHYLYVFEDTASNCFGHTLKNNVFKTYDITKVYASRGRAHFTELQGNSIFNDQANFVQVASGTTTPSVFGNDSVSTAVYAAPTTITSFLNGANGQTITVRMSVNTTIQHNASIKLKGAVNAGGGAAGSNDYIMLRSLLDVWVEMTRTW